jgi:hypothetical protein
MNFGRRGARTTLGLPGSGLSYPTTQRRGAGGGAIILAIVVIVIVAAALASL